jgi:hypothetical protein
MAKFSPLIVALLVPGLLAGCMVPTATKKTGIGATGASREGTLRSKLPAGTVGRPGAGTPDRAAPPPGGGLVANNSAGIVSNNSGGIIANNAGSLTGVVRAPASLIANNAGNIISGNTGGYRLLGTVTEAPVGNATVKLLYADGRAVTGADGKPITAVTDAQGKYTFAGILPAKNLQVAVELGDKGTLKAIASREGGEKRTVDVNLISTLTTGYILNQYVKGQADPNATFDKLPSSVEAETRAKATTAFEGGNTAVPARLTDTEVVQTVDALRQQSTTFNAQMEEVKKLLIAAGQSDLGAGRLGTEVNLDIVGNLLVTADGTLYITAPTDRRLWKLDAAGKLQTAAGIGTAGTESLTGKEGPTAPLASLRSVGLDAQGRFLIQEDDLSWELEDAPACGRLSWLGTDGKLTELSRAVGAGVAVPGTGDEVIVIAERADSDTGDVQVFSVKPGQAPTIKATLSEEDAEHVS